MIITMTNKDWIKYYRKLLHDKESSIYTKEAARKHLLKLLEAEENGKMYIMQR